MIKKTYNKNKSKCKVTFKFSPQTESSIETVQVVGNFNSWGTKKKQFLKKRKDGSYSLSLNLNAQSSYEYRFLINDKEWYTDDNADQCIWNIYGSQNALIEV